MNKCVWTDVWSLLHGYLPQKTRLQSNRSDLKYSYNEVLTSTFIIENFKLTENKVSRENHSLCFTNYSHFSYLSKFSDIVSKKVGIVCIVEDLVGCLTHYLVIPLKNINIRKRRNLQKGYYSKRASFLFTLIFTLQLLKQQ